MIYDPSNNGILSKGSDVGDNHSFLVIPLIKFNLIMAQVMQHQQGFYYQSNFIIEYKIDSGLLSVNVNGSSLTMSKVVFQIQVAQLQQIGY